MPSFESSFVILLFCNAVWICFAKSLKLDVFLKALLDSFIKILFLFSLSSFEIFFENFSVGSLCIFSAIFACSCWVTSPSAAFSLITVGVISAAIVTPIILANSSFLVPFVEPKLTSSETP